jgi:Spy/CpxP family protein refolding chaperone
MGGGMEQQQWPQSLGPQQGQGMPPGPPPASGGMTQSTMRGGMQLGPPGLWWDDRDFSRSIGLSRDQQRHMDTIFNANKAVLQSRYKDLQREESQLEMLTRARLLDEKQIFAQIDRVVQARGELEKANAHMLLAIREEMTPEQVERLDSHRPGMKQAQ